MNLSKMTMLIAAAALLQSTTAHAQVSLIEVTGVFDSVQSEDTGNLNTFDPLLNQPFTLTFAYDPSTPDAQDDVGRATRYARVGYSTNSTF